MNAIRALAPRPGKWMELGWSSLAGLTPRRLWGNPTLLLVYGGAWLCSILGVLEASGVQPGNPAFTLAIAAWLWLTLAFAAVAEAIAEGRGKAQAAHLRQARVTHRARRLSAPQPEAPAEEVPATELKKGDLVLVRANETIPCDGEVLAGIATVDESAITGESAPVIRESGGDRSAVTGGTRVLSDWLVVRASTNSGEGFLERMIAMIEGARRQRTPNEVALSILLAGMSLAFLIVTATLLPFSRYAIAQHGGGSELSVALLIALLVCLIPTTIGGLLPAIGIAGMDRMVRANVLAMSGRAVEAAGNVDVLLLDKTGTITLGNRQATRLHPAPGVTPERLAGAAFLASLADETPEGRSLVLLTKRAFGLSVAELEGLTGTPVVFSAQTRMSGLDLPGRCLRKGAAEALYQLARSQGQVVPAELRQTAEQIARQGGTPLVVAENGQLLGAVALEDVIKGGIRERFQQLRAMGIRAVMVTGDNPLTAAAVAAEAGVDDFLAEAKPEDKLALIRRYQAEGRLVAMTGDGTNDAPALAQADVAVAMNAGTQAAKEAANLVDLDSNPTKLLEIVTIGKQLLMTRGALTTFSLANDVAKYFAILPAAFAGLYAATGQPSPLLQLDVMALGSPESAVLSAVIFNAVVIVALIPLALRGVRLRPAPAAVVLRHNLLIYGLGGVLAPFIGIKGIDMLLALLGWP